MPLRVVHRAGGYQAWKDEKTISGPNWKMILLIIAAIFSCGAICSLSAIPFLVGGSGDEAPIPTLVALDDLITPSATAQFNVLVMQQPDATATPPPTETPTATATPEITPTADLMATMDYLLEQSTEPAPMTVSTSIPVFCQDAPFTRYPESAVLRVTFENRGALRLLDRPRQPDSRQPEVLKQLYDGDTVVIQGEPVCGAWLGSPVAYYPVFVPRWERKGYVGFGRSNDVWLEPNSD